LLFVDCKVKINEICYRDLLLSASVPSSHAKSLMF